MTAPKNGTEKFTKFKNKNTKWKKQKITIILSTSLIIISVCLFSEKRGKNKQIKKMAKLQNKKIKIWCKKKTANNQIEKHKKLHP